MDQHDGPSEDLGQSLRESFESQKQAHAQANQAAHEETQSSSAESYGTEVETHPSWRGNPFPESEKLSREEVERELDSLSRKPFQRILTDYLGFVPSAKSLRTFADKYPDRWANSIGVLAQLAGFKKDVVEVNSVVMIGHMDDASLFKRLAAAQAQLAETQRIIDPQIAMQPRELAPSRDPDIIDVKARELPKE